ncbi:MAG: hypothetical protein WAX69_04320 [Victivallales bacterium]
MSNSKNKTTQATTNPRMYPMPLPAKGSPDMLTHIDLRGVMELAGRNLLSNLDLKQDFLPNWCVIPNPDGSVKVGKGWPGHNLGRWWDAMLRLEEATGFHVPGDLKQAMLENVYRFFDNSDSICIDPNASACFELHSLREGMLALHALVRYRDDAWAKKKGHSMIETLLCALHTDGSWNFEAFKTSSTHPNRLGRHYDPTGSHGRMLEALIWFYQATGDSAALVLAQRSAEYHFANSTQADGGLNLASKPDHTHSYLGTLRGLLLFGELTGQRQYIDTVSATYEKIVRTLLKKSGFIGHDLTKDSGGETTSPGDAAQLALWLALRHNYTEYLDDVERIVRARLVPCQISELPPQIQSEFVPLLLGALGGCMGMPHGKKVATTDVTAAVLHSLIDVYNNIVVANETDLRVHFHFDYNDKNVCITSRREKIATVTITPKKKVNLWIRLPRWTPKESVRLVVAGKNLPLFIVGDYAFVPRDLMPAEVTLTYDLPVSTEIERTDGVDYSITWRGDEIIGISPNSDFLPFYPDAFDEHGGKQ